MTDLERHEPTPAVNVDTETLKYLGYDPADIATRALVLLAQKYELDPLLGEIQLIKTGQGTRVYVSRDGMLQVAHRSGVLDGIVVEQQRRNSTNDGWTCYVSVWRKDMGHPFTYGAQCKDSEPQAKAGNGPEQALARAERRALRRAFQIRGGDVDDLDGFDPVPVDAAPATGAAVRSSDLGLAAAARAGDWTPSDTDQADAHAGLVNWPVRKRLGFLGRWGIEHFEDDWPPEAVAEILAGPAAGGGP